MNTKRTLFLAIAIALTLLGSQPTQAQVAAPTVELLFEDASPSVTAGGLIDMTVSMEAGEPTKFNALAFTSDCAGVTGLPSGYATPETMATSQTVTMWFPPELENSTCHVSGQFTTFGSAHPTTTISVSAAVYVAPRAVGKVLMVSESNTALSGANTKFVALLQSNAVGPMVFGEVKAHLDCGPLFEDDYVIQSPSDPGIAQVLYFFAGMPATTTHLTCTWTGSFVSDGATYQLLETSFEVVPHVINLPFVID